MATILFAWELGGGLGHLTQQKPLAAALARRGHRVVFAMREVSWAAQLLADTSVQWCQAPFQLGPPGDAIKMPRSYPQILYNVGFADSRQLGSLIDAWRTLYELVTPSLVVIDHSPTALIAYRGLGARLAVVSTGFFAPPDRYPLPDLRPWLPPSADSLQASEDRVLRVINQALGQQRASPLERIGQIFAEADENAFVTFCELDHYGPRREARYWGAFSSDWGVPPQWPAGGGKRVFAYSKRFSGTEIVLRCLAERGVSAIVFAPSMPRQARVRFATPHIHIAAEPQDLRLVGETCDAAILHGTHTTVAQLLLKRIPLLNLPIYLEQLMLAQKVEGIGAGRFVPFDQPARFGAALDDLLNSGTYAAAACDFAERYRTFDLTREVEHLADRLESLLPGDGH